MIDKLTKQQESMFPVYRDKWLKIGLNTDRFDLPTAKPLIDDFYVHILKIKPAPIIILNDPFQAYIASSLFVGGQQVQQQVEQEVWQQVREQVWQQVGHQVRQQVRQQVWQQVEQQVWQQVKQQVREQVSIFSWPYADGNFWASWYSYYDFMESVLKIEFCKEYTIWKNLSKLSLIYPLKNFCFLSQKPQKINLKNGLLHADRESAISYADNLVEIYALNGIAVPKWLAITKDIDVDPAKILEISNADARREFVRKVGYDRIYYKLGGKILDTRIIAISNGIEMFEHRYEVMELNIGNGRKWSVLKMVNPSLSTKENEIYHIEGLPPECDTVEKALNFRRPERMKQIPIDDINGQDYYQHGDRVLWPIGAKSLKSLPTILT